MNQKKKQETLNKYQNLICRLAWDFSRAYSKPFEEMREEATYALLLQLDRWKEFYNPEKASEMTRVFQTIRFHLLNICTRSKPIPIPFSCLEKEEQIERPSEKSWLSKLLQEVSEEGRILIHTIVYAPDEILEEMAPKTRARARKAVREWLIDVKNWKEEVLQRTWNEVSVAIEGR